MNKPKRTREEHALATRTAIEEAQKHYHSQIAKIKKQKRMFNYVVGVPFVLFTLYTLAKTGGLI